MMTMPDPIAIQYLDLLRYVLLPLGGVVLVPVGCLLKYGNRCAALGGAFAMLSGWVLLLT